MLTNAISEAIFESSGFALAAVALIYAFLARKAGYSQLTRNIPRRIHKRLMVDASSRLDVFFDVSWNYHGNRCDGQYLTTSQVLFLPRCQSLSRHAGSLESSDWRQLPLSRRSIDLLENPGRKIRLFASTDETFQQRFDGRAPGMMRPRLWSTPSQCHRICCKSRL